jgi:type VI secretion system protein ImpA
MTEFSVDELLAPVALDAPCGADLEYDPAFVALENAAHGKPEQEFGNTLVKAEPPDWRVVAEQAVELARRTRDLRVAVLLARSGARVRGITAFASGMALIAGLLERHWEHVHPPLDIEDGRDPTMRINALAPLTDPATGLADLRSAAIGTHARAVTVRQIELAWGRQEPLPGEFAPSRDGVVQALRDAEQHAAGVLVAIRGIHADALRVESILAERVGAASAPDLRPLLALSGCMLAAAQAAGGAGVEAGPSHSPAQGMHAAAASDAIRSRADVLRVLDSACEWIERNEPSNPAPLLIRRAQRLMNKTFLDIVRDLAPDGLGQVEKIAGTAAQP